MIPFFDELGRSISAQWKQVNFSLADFPDIARRALDKNPPARRVDLAALIQDFLQNDEQPGQSQSGFGQPELIVFEHSRFYIQLLFWFEGTTQIHQHEFSGAFHVMKGSSIHSEFTFEQRHPITSHFQVGTLRMKGIELLPTGATVPIVSGGDHIHSLFHLDSPSLTVVVRTHSDPGTLPQFTYLPPHLAVDPFHTDALTTRRTQLLDVLERMESPTYAVQIEKMIKELDFERGFFILQNGVNHLQNLGKWNRVWAAFCRKHRALAPLVAPTLEEIQWRDRLVGLRDSVTEVEHRFFLALLLNAPTCRELLKLVRQSFSADPAQTVLRWAEELSESSAFGTLILDAEFPVEVNVPAEAQLPTFLVVLESLLKGKKFVPKNGARPVSPGDFSKFRESLRKSSLRALVSEASG